MDLHFNACWYASLHECNEVILVVSLFLIILICFFPALWLRRLLLASIDWRWPLRIHSWWCSPFPDELLTLWTSSRLYCGFLSSPYPPFIFSFPCVDILSFKSEGQLLKLFGTEQNESPCASCFEAARCEECLISELTRREFPCILWSLLASD